MKKIIISLLLFFLASFSCYASTIRVKIDSRVELTSIVFRMAGADEYVTNKVPTYLSYVDNYFYKYANHPLIKYIKEIRDPYRLYYNRVADMSFLFKIEDRHIVPLKNEKVKSWISRCWNEESAERYFQLLDSFYSDSHFELFLEQQRETYSASVDKTKQIVDSMNINTEWFESFFGEKMKDIEINIALLNGQHNYALPHDFESNDCFSVCIGCCSESNGIPFISEYFDNILIHEICHNIGNPIIDNFIDKIISFDKVYSHIKHMTKEYGYGDTNPNIAIGESLTNLFCAEYLLFSHWTYVGYHIANSEETGFLWMSDLVHFMNNFNSNRNLYPSIKEFMPQIVAYYNELPERIDAIELNYAAKSPYIESIYPAKGSTVSADIKEIRITLSQPVIEAWGHKTIYGIEPIPLGDNYRSEDHRTVIVPITRPLEPGKAYGIELEGFMFISEKTFHRMSNNYKLMFRTK